MKIEAKELNINQVEQILTNQKNIDITRIQRKNLAIAKQKNPSALVYFYPVILESDNNNMVLIYQTFPNPDQTQLIKAFWINTLESVEFINKIVKICINQTQKNVSNN